MMIAILMSRVLGQLRDTVIAFRFGQNELTDAYRAAFQLPDLLFFMVAGGALSSALIPVFSEYFSTDRKQEAWRVFSSVATVMLCVVIVLVLLGELFAPWIIRLMFPGFDEERLTLTVSLTRIVLPAQIFFLAGGLMMATLYARQHFLTPALGPNIYNLGIIFGGLALAIPFGIHGLAWGALIGAFAGNVLMPLWTMRRLGSQFSFRWDLSHPGARQVFKMMLPVMFGLSLPGIYMLILRVYGSLLPAGAISALDNANRQMQAPLGIVGQAIALGIFPTMAALAANAQWGELRRSLQQGLRLVWFLTLPATALLWVFAEDIGRVLLQYGKFKDSDTAMVAAALRMFSLGLFAWSGQALIARAFFSIKDSLTPVLIGSLTTVLFVPLCFLLMNRFNMNYAGLALATSIAATIQMIWMYRVLKRRLPPAEGEEPFLKPISLCALATLLSGSLAGLLRSPLAQFAESQQWQPNLVSAFLLLILGGGSFLVYLALTRWLGVPESRVFQSLLDRKRRQKAEKP
ncbi:MAG: murein biosynthesis integral membrane protein MurJ [Fimbriimonadia bacterium]|nr:murein biosynthesis integral membrane protein MurJ [Fimbriimonadia bacterium]